MLYKELDIYLESIKDIKMSCWWTMARYKHQAAKNISSVLAVLFGGQPRGLKNNIAGTSCKLCHMAVRETPQHVLFMCPGLEAQREALWHDVIGTIPNSLASDITRLNKKNKTALLLSCLGVVLWRNGRIYTNLSPDMYIKYTSIDQMSTKN